MRQFPRLSGRAAALSTLLALAACSHADPPQDAVPGSAPVSADPYAGGQSWPWTDRLDPPAADPYAGGRSYPWTGPRSPAGLGAAAQDGDNMLSDLSWTSASNAWGSVEKNQSNGDKFATDGRSLTLGGQVYAKGLGTHANSEVSYALGGMCTVFTAQIGVDDEVGDRGSVMFQVWNGTTKLYDSGVVTGKDAPKAVSVDVTGVQNLRLVVTDAADGISYDHADWADARVSCPPQQPQGERLLSALPWTSASNAWGPVERNQSNGDKLQNDGKPLTLGGQVFAKGLGTHANSEVSYALGGMCTVFTAQVGVDDEVGDRGSVMFQVWNGTTKLYDSGVVTGKDAPKAVSVDVTGVQNLRLVVTDAADGISYDHADWADAKVSCPADTAAPAAPTGLGAMGAADGITLGWAANAEPDLAGYRVERAAQPQGPFAPAHGGLLTAPGFSDPYAPENATSVYRVLAVDRAGNASAPATVSAARPQSAPVTTLRYSALPDQPQGVSEAQGRALNGRLYTFGGFDSLKGCCTPTNRAYMYDPATGRWTPLAPLPDRGVTHAGLATDGENFYVVGGYVADAAWTGQVFGTRAGWRYSVQNNTYTRLPDLPVERAGGQLEYLNGKLHYFGGTNLARTQNVGDHFVLDLAAGGGGWTVAAPLPLPRHHLGSAVLGGLIYAVGGQQGHDAQLVTQSAVQVYDPATDTWTSRAPLPRARGHISGSTFVLGGRLIVAGGEVAHERAIADVNAYDPATNTWTALTPLPSARASGVAAALGQGYLYTGGAWSRSGWRAQP